MLRALCLPSCKHLRSICLLLLHPPVYFLPAYFLPAFTSRIHIRYLKRKKEDICILQAHALTFHSYGNSRFLHIFFSLAKIWLGKTYAFYLEPTQGITNHSGEKTVKSVFLWKSSFSSPWRPPHSEAGTWSCMWTETGESTGWTLNLHLWHCTQRTQQITANLTQKPGLPQVQHTPLPLSCASIQLSTCPKAARFQVPAVQSGSHHLRRAVPALQGHTYTCIWSIPKTTLHFLGLTD